MLVVALGVVCLLTAGISAVLGMGGGVTLLAVMAALLPARDVVPLHGLVQLSSNATRTAAFIPHVRWQLAAVYTPFLVLGVTLATLVWSGDKLGPLRPGIGVFILLFLVWRRHKPKLRNLPLWTFAPVGVVAGFVTIFVGVTGPFVAPFFLRDDMSKEQVIATKAATQAAGHLFKLPAFLSLGYDYLPHLTLVVVLVVAVIAGTLLGKRVLGKISGKTFVMLFEAALSLVALFLVASPWVRP